MMGLFGKKKSAEVAKNRLLLVLQHERKPPYFEAMQEEIFQVIKKYTGAEKIEVTRHNDNSLEIEIILEKA